MVETREKGSSHWWLIDGHKKGHPNRSPWLQCTLAELDEKTKTMLKLIEEDADSFVQRAEMYYKNRPELIPMVEDLYRTHRSLAERYDQLKSESRNHPLGTWSSPLYFTKNRRLGKSLSLNEKAYECCSEAYGAEEINESEVDDPEQEEERVQDSESEKQEVSSDSSNEECTKLRKELERLREERKVQEEQLMQKDEEKRDVIRQLSLAMDLLREEI